MGGNRQSRHNPNGTGNLLEGSAWLRTAVQHYQKKQRHGGVSGFDSFTIEPCLVEVNGIQHFRVSVCFRNSKGKAQQVYWIVKVAEETSCASLLCHELRVYTEVLTDVSKFLSNKKNQRAKFLLNVPDFIFHDRLHQNGKNQRCHIVTEDVKETKRCTALQSQTIVSGLNLGEFKVLLGTLAQFHAVGIAWSLNIKDGSLLDLYPFLTMAAKSDDEKMRNHHLGSYQKILEKYFDENSRQRSLFKLLQDQADDLLSNNLQAADLNNVLGSLCLGPIMPTEIMFQYESSTFFDLCGVGGLTDNIIWRPSNSILEEVEIANDETFSLPICAAVTTCHRVNFGNILQELAVYFFTLPQALIRERYIVFLLQSYCHVLTMTLEMLDVDWQKHFGPLNFNKMIVEFYQHIPRGLLRSIIQHMERTDPDQLAELLDQGKTSPVIDSSLKVETMKYIPLTKERVDFLLSLLSVVHKPV